MYKNPISGIYYSDFCFEGVRYQKTLHVKTRSIAKTLEAKFRTEVISGKHAKTQQQRRHDVKFKVAMQDYLSRESINLKSHERNEYSSKHLLPFFGNTSLSAVTPESITDYKLKRKKENATGATCNRELALLKRVFNWYSQQHRLRIDNPVKGIEFFKEVSRDRVMTEEEEQRFYTQGKPLPILRDLVKLALLTGMRTSEMIKLKTSDIVLGDLGGYIQLRDTKTGDNRRVLLTDELTAFMRRVIKDYSHESEYVFFNPEKKKPYFEFKEQWRNACKRAGIAGLRFHDLRHTFCTRMANEGVNSFSIMKIVGHKDAKTALRYCNPTDEHLLAAMKKLGKNSLGKKSLKKTSAEKPEKKSLEFSLIEKQGSNIDEAENNKRKVNISS